MIIYALYFGLLEAFTQNIRHSGRQEHGSLLQYIRANSIKPINWRLFKDLICKINKNAIHHSLS